jgi:hypothetical protein
MTCLKAVALENKPRFSPGLARRTRLEPRNQRLLQASWRVAANGHDFSREPTGKTQNHEIVEQSAHLKRATLGPTALQMRFCNGTRHDKVSFDSLHHEFAAACEDDFIGKHSTLQKKRPRDEEAKVGVGRRVGKSLSREGLEGLFRAQS